MNGLVVLWHLGALHSHEKLFVLLVAFGPFVLLSFAVRYAQRRNLEEETEEEDLSGRPPAT